jgi:hypothetical protein
MKQNWDVDWVGARGLVAPQVISCLRRYQVLPMHQQTTTDSASSELHPPTPYTISSLDACVSWRGRCSRSVFPALSDLPTESASDGALHHAKRIAIIGGSFSPITVAHTYLAAEVARCSRDLSAVWLLPCGARPDKPSLNVNPLMRYMMCIIALEASLPFDPATHSTPVLVSSLEIREPQAIPS